MNDAQLDQRDAAEQVNRLGAGPAEVHLTASDQGGHFMLIKMKQPRPDTWLRCSMYTPMGNRR